MTVTGRQEQEPKQRQSGITRDSGLHEKFLLRNIKIEESDQAVRMETICFPPNEACSEEMIISRIERVPPLFLVAEDRTTKKLAGFLSGIATNEIRFRDEFFSDASLHEPDGKNIMLLGLNVLPEYRGQGVARELMCEYLRREREKGRECVRLTCLPAKVDMYKKMGFSDEGLSDSTWGGEQWHEMSYVLAP